MSLTTSGLTKRYASGLALAGVDLRVQDGSVYGLVGPNGAGKTTLLALLAGLRRPTSGQISLGVARHGVALLPDTPQFDPWLTGREVVALAARLVGATQDRVGAFLHSAGLDDAADRRVGGYSRGMLQRLGLAATLVGDPQLLLLDEPASALDPAGRREVLDLIADLRGRATVVLSSHLLGDVRHVCDAVGVLRAGRLLYQGPLDELLVGHAVPAYRVVLRSPAAPVLAALAACAWVTDVREAPVGSLRIGVRTLAEAEEHLTGVLAACGARTVSANPEAPDLEDVFLELTS